MSYAPAFRPTLEDESLDKLGGGIVTGHFLYRRRELLKGGMA
jgi:hypothetical protein